ncbi:MAG: flagellar export chaperone FliS [Candidatus Dactylopiibacterium carminicum]|uniref:Flagellar secretion chaperone FliS n=1 Tax=Candidatus Dactylopiibacterium carminicum TaxID=857335 RepID=A0A272EVG5_9RHOO|nr:flagellar export chaperone FliS [Candidatus Dactylopiibacterium carminicum]KAF7598168.1 flagellar export chaperone FliS [Candidatus Dactylopiibacterium carminicum]PAS94109.1 MAG: flagellar export chaperone FliS [Candidatus Dactylopiibacterium carminicum]PAS96854.1 MAG: flagellar export chaperone FliS [Candidatus Dactylopiibacterium carminicum]PAS98127.1 MAG: flagellar export chaperone FliS [Candidatus Dactylopiibacterium carminicum]
MFARQSAAAYARIGVQTNVATADPHRLILMLFDGALMAINSGAVALESKDVQAKIKHIGKAIEIISMGLKASLDTNAGGELAQRLDALYDYMINRLIYANAFNTDVPLTEVAGLLRDLRDAWSQIGDAVQTQEQEA